MNMKQLYTALKKVEDMFLIGCLAVMGLVLFAQVVFRYFFNTPLMWSEEMSRYLQIWLTFLGIGYGLRNDSHISMVLVFNKFPEQVKTIIQILTNLFIIGCFAMFIPGAVRFVADQNQILSSAMSIPMSWVYYVGPLGGVIYCLYTMGNTCELLKKLYITFSSDTQIEETA